ncbi:MAG: hypothetical protein ACR2PY_03980, partial [Salinispira sp.]
LFEYVKGWIDIPKYESGNISALWRGWYIIPDQGYVDDNLVDNVKLYLPFINDGVALDDSNANFRRLLEQFEENSEFQRDNLKTSYRDLFVRQTKNYLLKFGWCHHPIKDNGKPNKQLLYLTDLGNLVNKCNNLREVKDLYTDYFLNYSFNGLLIISFTNNLLRRLDYLTLNEFNFFVNHAYNDEDLSTIVDLVKMYRSLSSAATHFFDQNAQNYFKEVKGLTASNVYGNYVKSIKHTMSAIGWCNGFSFRLADFTLNLENETS